MFKSMDAQQAVAFATQLREAVESGQEILSAVEQLHGRYPDGKVESPLALTVCWEYSLEDGSIWSDSVGVVTAGGRILITLSCNEVRDHRLASELCRLTQSPEQITGTGCWEELQ